jgi:DNA polymerase bacteriophage-type
MTMEECLSLDFETRSLVDIKLGAWRYAEDPSTEILCLAYKFNDMPAPQVWRPGRAWPSHEEFIRDWITHGLPVRAWNVEFELAIWTRIMVPKFGIPKLKPGQLRCTQAEACAMGLPQALDECGKALKLPQDKLKDQEGKKLIQYLCKPFKGKLRTDPERLKALGEYCRQDVVAEVEIARKLRRLDRQELKLFQRNLVMNNRGMPVDLKRVSAMQRRVDEVQEILVDECAQLTGGIRPAQRDQLLAWLRANGYPDLPDLQKKTIARLLEQPAPEYTDGWAKRVLSIRQQSSQTSLAKLKKAKKAVCKDGTMKGLYKYHAASTGRWASQGGFNAQNLPRGTLEDLRDMVAVLEHIPHASLKELVSCLRAVFAFEMSAADYSQIETRMLLWLSKDSLGLQEFRRGLDPYKTMAASMYHVKYDDVTKAQRQIGKSAVLGAGFQLGAPGFITYCDNQDIFIDLGEAQLAISTFRAKYRRVAQSWKDMQGAAVRAIQNPGMVTAACRCRLVVENGYLWMRLPSGRRICWKSPWLTPGREEWMGPQINYWGKDRYTRQWGKQETYGGSLFQSATQGSARDVMADAMLRMWDAGLDLRGTVHDEIIAAGDCLKQMIDIMLQPPAWCADLPLKVEGWTGDFYRK